MRMRLGSILFVVSAALPNVTAAQTASFSASARASAAIMLPHAAIELRAAGVPAPEVRTALVEVRTHRIPAPEVHLMFTRSVELVHVHGPLPHFGVFVRAQLGEGVRGPRLVEVLRVEHREQGRRPRGHAKGHALDTPGHRRHGHSAPAGPPGHVGMGSVRVEGAGMGSVRVRAPRGGGSVHGGGMGSVRVRSPAGGGGPVRVRPRGGGGGGRGGGMR